MVRLRGDLAQYWHNLGGSFEKFSRWSGSLCLAGPCGTSAEKSCLVYVRYSFVERKEVGGGYMYTRGLGKGGMVQRLLVLGAL